MESFIRLTKAAEIIGVKPHVLRNWLAGWEPFASRDTRERSAVEFSPVDFAFIWVAKELIVELGMSKDVIGDFSADLYVAVQRHWFQKSEESVVLQKPPGKQWTVSGKKRHHAIRIELPIAELRRQSLLKLGIGEVWVQAEIPVGLVAAK